MALPIYHVRLKVVISLERAKARGDILQLLVLVTHCLADFMYVYCWTKKWLSPTIEFLKIEIGVQGPRCVCTRG
ncbi:hypothetical protein DFH28DRAFT_243646 [Melampsora americana]|nr:hypothetical protein DFH28DRAFT_243646 [Melampsora americana]